MNTLLGPWSDLNSEALISSLTSTRAFPGARESDGDF